MRGLKSYYNDDLFFIEFIEFYEVGGVSIDWSHHWPCEMSAKLAVIKFARSKFYNCLSVKRKLSRHNNHDGR